MDSTDGVRQLTHRFAQSASRTSSVTSGSPLVPGHRKWPGRRHPLIAGRARDDSPIGIGDHQVRAKRPVMPVGMCLGMVPHLLDLPARSALPRFQRPVVRCCAASCASVMAYRLPAEAAATPPGGARGLSGRGLRLRLHRDLRRPGGSCESSGHDVVVALLGVGEGEAGVGLRDWRGSSVPRGWSHGAPWLIAVMWSASWPAGPPGEPAPAGRRPAGAGLKARHGDRDLRPW